MADFYVNSTVDFEVPNDNQFSADPTVVFQHPGAVSCVARQAPKFLIEYNPKNGFFVHSGVTQVLHKLPTISPIYHRSPNAVG